MERMQIKDSAVAIFIAGGIATTIQIVFSWVLYALNIVKQNPTLFHVRLLTNKWSYTTGEFLLGLIGNLTGGIFFAIFILLLLRVTGTDYAYLKGAFVGLVNSMLQFYIFPRLFVNPTRLIPDAPALWHVYIGYVLWGIITAYILKKYHQIKIIDLD